jgi:hypothetical protein
MTKFFKNLRQQLVFRQRQTYAPVTRKIAGAGQNEIPHTGQAHKGFALRTERQAKAGDFCQTTGHQCSARVESEPQAVANAGSDRENVFDRAAHFNTNQIIICVNAETTTVQLACGFSGENRIISGKRDGSRLPGGNFFGKARAGQGAANCLRTKHFGYNLMRQ